MHRLTQDFHPETSSCGPNPRAGRAPTHQGEVRLRQLPHHLHPVVSMDQVQAQHVGQQGAAPLPRRAAQVLQVNGGAR